MSMTFCARYNISSVEDKGSGIFEVTGKVYDSYITGYLAADATVGDAIIDENIDTGAVNKWKVTSIISASARDLVCRVTWDDDGTADPNGPVTGDACITSVSTNLGILEVPVLAYTGLSENIQIRIVNINSRIQIDGNTGTYVEEHLAVAGQYYHAYTAATTWTVSHNLNASLILVQCYSNDTVKKMIVPKDISLDTANQCTVDWGDTSVAGSVCVVKLF